MRKWIQAAPCLSYNYESDEDDDDDDDDGDDDDEEEEDEEEEKCDSLKKDECKLFICFHCTDGDYCKSCLDPKTSDMVKKMKLRIYIYIYNDNACLSVCLSVHMSVC